MKINKESINKNEFKIDSLAFNKSNLDSFGKDIIAVSYTHLDVYKRQL